MNLVRKIASRVKKGTPEIFHTVSAVQKSGWRDFPQDKGRASFESLIQNVAAGTTLNAPLFDALTALSATCGVTLSSHRAFLNQSLWDVWQSSGGCDAALQEVAVLVRERRIDWLNDRDRLLVLEYFREIRQGTTTAAPWTSLSDACRRPDFDIRDAGDIDERQIHRDPAHDRRVVLADDDTPASRRLISCVRRGPARNEQRISIDHLLPIRARIPCEGQSRL